MENELETATMGLGFSKGLVEGNLWYHKLPRVQNSCLRKLLLLSFVAGNDIICYKVSLRSVSYTL